MSYCVMPYRNNQLPNKLGLDSFDTSHIHQYIESYPNIVELVDINKPQLCMRCFYMCKLCNMIDALLQNNLDEIIYDMINIVQNNSDDMIAICLVAIINERLDIIPLLVSREFDFSINIFDRSNSDFHFGSKNLIDYAMANGKISIVRVLLDMGIEPTIISKLNDQCTDNLNNFSIDNCSIDDEYFDFIIDSYPKYHTPLLILSIYKNDIDRIIKLCNINPNLINDLVQNFSNYIKHDSCIGEIKLDTFKLLVNYGLIIDDSFFEIIFGKENSELVDYLMSTYNFVPSDTLIKGVFNKISHSMIEILFKHRVDLSKIKPKISLDDIFHKLEECNMDPAVYFSYIFTNSFAYIGWNRKKSRAVNAANTDN